MPFVCRLLYIKLVVEITTKTTLSIVFHTVKKNSRSTNLFRTPALPVLVSRNCIKLYMSETF